mgnify:CR=1 FL=1
MFRNRSYSITYTHHRMKRGRCFFQVWPAVYLYANGPILTKGVAQGLNQPPSYSRYHHDDVAHLNQPVSSIDKKTYYSTLEQPPLKSEIDQNNSPNISWFNDVEAVLDLSFSHDEPFNERMVSPTNDYVLERCPTPVAHSLSRHGAGKSIRY